VMSTNNGYGWSLILDGSDPGRPHAPARGPSCLANGELIRHILADSALKKPADTQSCQRTIAD